MDTRHLQEFAHLAISCSFTKTASSFHIVPSTLSKHIAALEKELGISLFLRSTNSVELTEHGKAFYKGVLVTLKEYEDAVIRAKLTSEEEVKTICIGGNLLVPSINSFLYAIEARIRKEGLPLRINHYAPHVSDCIPLQAKNDPLDLLAKREVDVLIVEGPECFPEKDKFDSERVFDEGIVFFANEESPLSRKSDLMLCDLEEQTFVCSINYPHFHDRIREICAIRGFEPKTSTKICDSFNDYMQTERTDEVLFLSASGGQRVPLSPVGQLVLLDMNDQLCYSPVYVISRKGEGVGFELFRRVMRECIP